LGCGGGGGGLWWPGNLPPASKLGDPPIISLGNGGNGGGPTGVPTFAGVGVAEPPALPANSSGSGGNGGGVASAGLITGGAVFE